MGVEPESDQAGVEAAVEVSDDDQDPDPEKETGWSKQAEESLNTLQKAAFELEQEVACNNKSHKRISGADSQANIFVELSMARRQAAREDAEKGVGRSPAERRGEGPHTFGCRAG